MKFFLLLAFLSLFSDSKGQTVTFEPTDDPTQRFTTGEPTITTSEPTVKPTDVPTTATNEPTAATNVPTGATSEPTVATNEPTAQTISPTTRSSRTTPAALEKKEIASGSYVRSYQLPDNTLLSCTGGGDTIPVYKKNTVTGNWDLQGSVTNPSNPTTNTQFTNCFLYMSSRTNGRLLLAARYHTGCDQDTCTYYSIRVFSSTDSGVTWSSGGVVVEEIQHTSQNILNVGLWEPSIFEIKTGTGAYNLNIYYAREYLDTSGTSKLQELVQRTSTDYGMTWPISSEIIASKSGTRDGMPSVTQLPSGTVILAMETSVSGQTITSTIKSYDYGATWPETTRDFPSKPVIDTNWQSSASGIGYSPTTKNIVLTFILNKGLKQDDDTIIATCDSYDGYTWGCYTWIAIGSPALWPNIYLYNNRLYAEFDINEKSYTTIDPVDKTLEEYLPVEYGVNRPGYDDFSSEFSPMPNVGSNYDCYNLCLFSTTWCMTFHWNTGNNCWLKSANTAPIPPNPVTFSSTPNMFTTVLSSRWYYGANIPGNDLATINGITTKPECLFRCVTDANCAALVYDAFNDRCFLKNAVSTSRDQISFNTWIWTKPGLVAQNRGTYDSNLNSDTMSVYANGMEIYSGSTGSVLVHIPNQVVQNGEFTWKFPWGVLKMTYDAVADVWKEDGTAVWAFTC